MTSTTYTGAKLLVDCLVKHQVEIIFAIPGAKIDSIFDVLLDSPIKVVVCRHEQNAAFMAAAYGRLTGKPGVVLVTSGPGVANLVTGLLTATSEGDPVLAIGGNVARSMLLKQSHQSSNNIKLTEAVTKFRAEVMLPDTIPEVVENAIRHAVSARSGAVFISLPQDVLLASTTVQANQPATHIQLGPASPTALQEAANIINAAKCPILFLGLDASRPTNTAAIRRLLTTVPLATIGTYQAAGVVSRELVDCFVGRVGLFHNQPGDQLIEQADVILTIGYSPIEYDPEIWNAKQNKTIIHLDYEPADIHLTYQPTLELPGDIASNLDSLTVLLKERDKPEKNKIIHELQSILKTKIESGAKKTGKLIHPLRFIHDLKMVSDDDTIIVSDIGSHYMWLARYLFSYQPHHLLFSNGQQTLRVGLPWAMAANFVYPNKKIIGVSGDGGFLFSAMELETAVREKLRFVQCVWCDGGYNMVKEQQMMKYHRESAAKFGNVDLVKFAESFGAYGFRVNDSDELLPTLKKALTLDKPVLIEIPIDYKDNPELFKSVLPEVGN